MVRKGGTSTQHRPASTSAKGNTIPPPSTIAAQIVNNATATKNSTLKGQPQDGGATTKIPFPELLREFLRNPIIDDLDPQLNVQFISTIVEAGLDALNQGNPFALERPKDLASDSLRAIRISIWQIPQLLLSTRAQKEGDGVGTEPPVFLWLFTKILGLVDVARYEGLHSELRELLSTFLKALGRSQGLWKWEEVVARLYRGCVDSILSTLETPDITPTLSPQCHIVLPPLTNVSDLWPESQSVIALPQGCQITLTSRSKAILVGLMLVQSLLDYSEARHEGQRTTVAPFLDNYLPWILDSCLTLWRCFRLGRPVERNTVYNAIETNFMDVLGTATLPCIRSRDSPYSLKAAIALSTNLADLIQSCTKSGFPVPNQTRLASLVVRLREAIENLDGGSGGTTDRRRDIKNLITDTMAPVILGTCENEERFASLEKDLQLALCLWTSSGNWPAQVIELRSLLCSGTSDVFSDTTLQGECASVVRAFKHLNVADDEPPTKRRRTTDWIHDNDHLVPYKQLVMRVTGSTQESPVLGLSGLHESILDIYRGRGEEPKDETTDTDMVDAEREAGEGKPLDNDGQNCELIQALGTLACAGTRCLRPLQHDRPASWKDMGCDLCDTSQPCQRTEQVFWDKTTSGDDWKDAIAAMLTIIGLQEFRESAKPRIHMALAIRRVFNHISNAEYLNLEDSALGEWLLSSMSSSLRELRIAAVQALMVFLRTDVPQPIRGKNRMLALEFFDTLSKKDTLSVHETLIMAYGQAARVCGEDELPIILLQLVEYLGHTNALICAMAYNELASVADAFKKKPVDLLRPYWRSIGVSLCKDLRNKPQKAQHLSDLTEQSVTHLLLSTQADILPYLVLTKRKDILQQIATARGSSIQDVCIQPHRHLANILALLLCQPVSDVEKSAMDALVAVSPAFGESGFDLSDYVKYEPVMVACEILKSAADQHESKKPQYHRGFRTLVALADMKNGQRKSSGKKKALEAFFEVHLLGIMAHFSEILDSAVSYPVVEKKRCVGAINEMITIAGNCASSALPQIRASLQSAMADPQLCDQTFLVWSALLAVLDEEDLELVIDQTFALIVQNWTCFSEETHVVANETLMGLVHKHNALLRERIGYIPSLASIPMLSKLEAELSRLKDKVDKASLLSTFSQRLNDENAIVVRHALKELVRFLETNQKILHQAAVSQKPFPGLPALTRSLLDACVRFAEDHQDIPTLCARCLGQVGGLDPYKVETVREKKHILVLSNFERLDEVIDFCAFLLERVLVKVFHSTTNSRTQGFLAYVMQELLRACGFTTLTVQRPRASQPSPALQRWIEIPETVRNTLTPFLSSRYTIRGISNSNAQEYPIFKAGVSHSGWLRAFVYDLLQSGKGENAQMIFTALARIIKGHDLSIATFILPFAVLNHIITGEEKQTAKIGQELLTVLQAENQVEDQTEASTIKQCSENVFQVLDYLALWLQEKRKSLSDAKLMAGKTGRGISEEEQIKDVAAISCVERVLQLIPAEVISRRAVECGSYARALYHWEQYYRQERQKAEDKGESFESDELMQHLQLIYAQIDEPDCIEGISAHLQVLNPDQQIIEHRKAGRWTAAQSWYELSLAEKPNDAETQINLLTCLKESGQYDSILNYVDGFQASNSFSPSTLPFAAEAAWSTGKWGHLERMLGSASDSGNSALDFNVGVGRALLALRGKQPQEFKTLIEALRAAVAKDLSPTSTMSLHACHDSLVKLHVLYEMEAISGVSANPATDKSALIETLDRRLDVLGAYTSDKQYLLGVRRAVMQLSRIEFTNLDVASAWLTTARLARKADFMATAFTSVLHAAQLGDDASKIEYSKLLWKEGHHRKAIQNLQGAITSNAFLSRDTVPVEVSVSRTMEHAQSTNKVKAQAELLLAKWLDRAGQTKALALKDAYASGIMSYPRWDKGHYYLGRHYDKLLESEKALPVSKQTNAYFAGEYNKLIIENYVRCVVYGTKYYYQTIPKVLTLWLDLGMEVVAGQPKGPREKEMYQHKVKYLEAINRHIKRYTNERMPAYAWYTAFPQIITRIAHPSDTVWEVLQTIIVKVAAQYPQQALWSLLPVTKATQHDRRARGLAVLQKLKTETVKRRTHAVDLNTLIVHGQRLTDALLSACDHPVEPRVTHVSLSRDLGFNTKLAPCPLVVPIEATMTASLPSTNDSKVIRNHNPFPTDAITISSFTDDVLVLSSLQRPRKLTVRGSDGRSYGLLCKPKDDLRKDQRLMEFNAVINRALTRDNSASRRRLYIKTYGVTPLNEECGIIEWVEGLKPMRDIIIRLYRQKGVNIDYTEIRNLLAEACSAPNKSPIFTDVILKKFPPVLYEWFIESFPSPDSWFAARTRYTRSCAVMSIVGHVLGLGDRHGENVLLEEGNGGTFHVDFNCLFDKGLTFKQPELVPFRLTHNMVDAMGPQGIEGAFRTSAEITYALLRQHRDTLITILETFVHDPTADFLSAGGGGARSRKRRVAGVPETPQEVLESVRGKVEGLMKGETVPLSVEGYVDALVGMARDERNLAGMYIGWCAFF
ncbi:protein kinase rad3 [Westerdykella ornata]|uniref:Serine/threonine-protein kinase MEC1 n=1 Tax=Westerdykella ornata TaxID=318751 RepID=A0A6A6JUK5_WESOR|nr:protein kinase rad3 [Westerdykella ornata]KAF2280300.1 protein kinase rad3 [Westerdykella ornata]